MTEKPPAEKPPGEKLPAEKSGPEKPPSETPAKELSKRAYMEKLTLRLMKSEELEDLPKYWKDEVGIAVDLRVIRRWYRLDPEGFRVAVDSQDKIVGMTTVIKQNDLLYVLGYLGVPKELRGQGIASKLLQYALSRCPNANFALNSDSNKLQIYTRRGFKEVKDTNGFSFIGKFPQLAERKPPETDLEVVTIAPAAPDLRLVTQYDKEVCGFERSDSLLQLTGEGVIVLGIKQRGKIVAYGKIQPYLFGGAWLGPLYADGLELAQFLFYRLVRRYENQDCAYLFTIVSDQFKPFAKTLMMKQAEKLTRCYLRPDNLPPVKLKKVYTYDDPGFAFV
ncbi:uncharacterized protein LOC111264665 [Varroa jacobsoni]|uniref:N-acetyltransferase domain-containing protein n=1 Tax=Varroa destructor TaxID=109461 RepID=A0A7M7K0Z8_VARDE|nr:uncharacterized protein LOC111249769 [Varroa destructor]XP_022696461.1 uncharacterized protein LOC111264665 [Varroa jacobsoni]